MLILPHVPFAQRSSCLTCYNRTVPLTDSETILAMEHAALARWAQGDVQGFLEISEAGVDYFDPFQARRVDGLAALRTLYESFPAFKIDSWQILNPRVEVAGDMALLTFNYVSQLNGREMRWNTTEVYHRTAGQWRILHTHWSFTKPQLAAAGSQ
jgi:ketosteroid isomerase-like protein